MRNNVKNTTFLGLFDLLFPHSCRGCGHLGSVLCDRCKNYIIKSHKDICPNCKTEFKKKRCKNCKDLPPVYVVGGRIGLLGDLIKDYKYHSIRALSGPLAELLDAVLPKDLPENSVLVPLPTATHHIRQRGFDHTRLIVKHLGKLRGLPVEYILERNKNTVQVGADSATRLAQASSAYKVKENVKIDKNKTYILLDDVWTTGSSILSAAEKLKSAGAKNLIAALLAYNNSNQQ